VTCIKPVRVFISYASEDRDQARLLYEELTDADPSLEIWFDKVSLDGGVEWKRAIRRAIRDADVFLLLLSSSSTTKAGYVQREIREATEVLQSLPEGHTFVVPVRLEACDPHFEFLEELHRIDLFPSWSEGVARIRRALDLQREEGASDTGAIAQPEEGTPGAGAAKRILSKISGVIDAAELGPYFYVAGFVVTEYGDWNNLERPITGRFQISGDGEPEYLLQVGIAGQCDPAHVALELHDAVGMHIVTTRKEVKGVFALVVPREFETALDFFNDNMIARSVLGDRGQSVLLREQELDGRFLSFLEPPPPT